MFRVKNRVRNRVRDRIRRIGFRRNGIRRNGAEPFYSTSPAGLGNDHFGAEFVKFLPQFLELKMTLDVIKAVVARRT